MKAAHPAGRSDRCPCGSDQPFDACCCRYLDGSLPAPDAESLMRSRYSAYVLDRRGYLLETWHASTRPNALPAPEAGLRWLGLDLRSFEQFGPDQARVRFIARSKLNGRAHRLDETSRFVREQGRWYYLDGTLR